MKHDNKNYCCDRFKTAVDEALIIKSVGYDETEWYLPESYHLYFRPFCGAHIKGKGFGKYDEQNHSLQKPKN